MVRIIAECHKRSQKETMGVFIEGILKIYDNPVFLYFIFQCTNFRILSYLRELTKYVLNQMIFFLEYI